MAILIQHFQELPTPPALINPRIPQALSEVILKSIAKDPDARFPSASDMTGAVARSLNVAVPTELMKAAITPDVNGANSSHALQPSQPLKITPAPRASLSFQSSPSPGGQAPLTAPTGGSSFTNPTAQASLAAPPAILQPPASQAAARRRRTHPVLIALLVAAVVGSGLLLAFFALNRTIPSSPANPVVGQVRFLSSPSAAHGSIDEVDISMLHISDPPSGELYYAWLQVNSENKLPINWPLTTQNGRLSSPAYSNPSLLKNRPYLFLITLEKANSKPTVATFVPGARLFYASLPAMIQHAETFDIRPCPQNGSAGICMS